MLLSDIPVHREQAPPRSRYFDPADPEDIAVALLDAFREGRPGPDAELEARARDELPGRTREFARRFMRVMESAADESSAGEAAA